MKKLSIALLGICSFSLSTHASQFNEESFKEFSAVSLQDIVLKPDNIKTEKGTYRVVLSKADQVPVISNDSYFVTEKTIKFIPLKHSKDKTQVEYILRSAQEANFETPFFIYNELFDLSYISNNNPHWEKRSGTGFSEKSRYWHENHVTYKINSDRSIHFLLEKIS